MVTGIVPSHFKVKYVYKKSDDYKLHFINGAYGGFTSSGDLVCNFYFESQDIPAEEEAIVEGAQITPIEKDDSDTKKFVRELKSGIIMTPQEMVALRDWFNIRIKQFNETFIQGSKEICK